jgi:hypothetical protein
MLLEVTTRATPEQVRETLIDFSDRRLRTWHRTLDPKTYEVREQGDTWAVARESTAGSPFWGVFRYDWSDPSVIRTTVVECSWGGSGSAVFWAVPSEGGSRVHAEWTHTGVTSRRDRILLALIHTRPMRRFVARQWVNALNEYADTDLASRAR